MKESDFESQEKYQDYLAKCRKYNKRSYERHRLRILKKMKDNYDKDKKKEYDKNYRIKNRERLIVRARKDNRTFTGRYSNAKSLAKKRNISFDLSLEEYIKLIEENCFYCNGYFGKVETQCGLDRKDNSKGYSVDNCVSCCTICNRAKGAHFSVEETKIAIEAIILYRKRKEIS